MLISLLFTPLAANFRRISLTILPPRTVRSSRDQVSVPPLSRNESSREGRYSRRTAPSLVGICGFFQVYLVKRKRGLPNGSYAGERYRGARPQRKKLRGGKIRFRNCGVVFAKVSSLIKRESSSLFFPFSVRVEAGYPFFPVINSTTVRNKGTSRGTRISDARARENERAGRSAEIISEARPEKRYDGVARRERKDFNWAAPPISTCRRSMASGDASFVYIRATPVSRIPRYRDTLTKLYIDRAYFASEREEKKDI